MPPVGFFNAYPFVDVGMADGMPSVGASLVTCIAGGFSMNPQEGDYDFSVLDRQIEYAAEHKLPLSIISEINPLVCSAVARGQGQRRPASWSATGPARRESSRRSHRSLPAGPAATRPTRRGALAAAQDGKIVEYIHPGAEWWFPLADRYHPADIARVSPMARRRYRTIGELNLAWESRVSARSTRWRRRDWISSATSRARGWCARSPWTTDIRIARGARRRRRIPKAVAGQGGVIRRHARDASYAFSAWAKASRSRAAGPTWNSPGWARGRSADQHRPEPGDRARRSLEAASRRGRRPGRMPDAPGCC